MSKENISGENLPSRRKVLVWSARAAAALAVPLIGIYTSAENQDMQRKEMQQNYLTAIQKLTLTPKTEAAVAIRRTVGGLKKGTFFVNHKQMITAVTLWPNSAYKSVQVANFNTQTGKIRVIDLVYKPQSGENQKKFSFNTSNWQTAGSSSQFIQETNNLSANNLRELKYPEIYQVIGDITSGNTIDMQETEIFSKLSNSQETPVTEQNERKIFIDECKDFFPFMNRLVEMS